MRCFREFIVNVLNKTEKNECCPTNLSRLIKIIIYDNDFIISLHEQR